MNLDPQEDNSNRKNRVSAKDHWLLWKAMTKLSLGQEKNKEGKRSMDSSFILLSCLQEDMFFKIHNSRVLLDPKTLKGNLTQRETSKFCEYHTDHDYNTDDFLV